ncbi:hypothetical protein BD414DRAFT_175232 [Trametes punicea]|nr:hypothetical protein BD414DRAFT_175232 [Trametes punicea]
MHILDNDLRKYLVDALPDGVFLTAIFDACHSGTLLDLVHYNCNAVSFQWLKTRSDWRSQSRAKMVSNRPEGELNDWSPCQLDSCPLLPRTIIELVGGRNDYLVGQRANNEVDGPVHTASHRQEMERKRPTPKRASTLQFLRTSGVTGLKSAVRRRYSLDQQFELSGLQESIYMFMKNRCTSPEPVEPLKKCTGACKPAPDPGVPVVSISSCSDSQETYEPRDGQTMTQILIGLLKKDPHPACRSLVKQLGDELYASMEGLRRLRRMRRKFLPFNVPILGSQRPLVSERLHHPIFRATDSDCIQRDDDRIIM